MRQKINLRSAILIIGDIFALYIALFITLILRYGGEFYIEFLELHFLPFTIVFAMWILIFRISGLYNLRGLRNSVEFLKVLGSAIFTGGIIAIAFFYLAPWFIITPKTNLFIFIGVFAVLEIFWRRAINQRLASAEALYNIVLVGSGTTAEKIHEHITSNPALGYSIKQWLKEDELAKISSDTDSFLEKSGAI